MDQNEMHPSHSQVQQAAEAVMMSLLSKKLGVQLVPAIVELADGVRVHIDGVSGDPPFMVEASARQGRPRGAQFHKIASDALKLSAAGASLGDARMILLFADEAAAEPFRLHTWRGVAIARLGIEVVVVNIPVELRDSILAAQALQYR